MAGGATVVAPEAAAPAFRVHLDVYDGPFDLLLSLIAKHRLDVTEVALAQVTDEFVAYLRAGGSYDLEQTTAFLVVAATLLDLKAARLLPQAVVDDEGDLALLEARDLLFARLLQYRAYKQAAAWLATGLATESLWTPRAASLPPEFAALLPELVLRITPDQLAALAAAALAPTPGSPVDTEHVHVSRVSVRAHVAILTERLTALGTASFRALCADCQETIEVVARFLGVLQLVGEQLVTVVQLEALGELQVRWTGPQA